MYGECDLYYCERGGLPDTVIARYGNGGPEYTSGLCFVGMVPAITEAFERAKAAGIQTKYNPPLGMIEENRRALERWRSEKRSAV